jgi:hypothetical protein
VARTVRYRAGGRTRTSATAMGGGPFSSRPDDALWDRRGAVLGACLAVVLISDCGLGIARDGYMSWW